MAAVEDRPRRGRGRRPADEVRAEIVAAAGELLFVEGMAAFTIDKVAARSGASKMTIYKWWPSKGALALDGYFHRVEQQLQFPDTGNIEVDLRAQLHAFLAVVRDSPAGSVIAELIGQAQSDPDLKAAYLQRYSSPRRALAVSAMETAKVRGQLRADLDPEPVVDQLWGACYHRLLLPDQPLTEEFVDALMDNLFRGIAPPR
jgi:AcrR family transcriptional regulator